MLRIKAPPFSFRINEAQKAKKSFMLLPAGMYGFEYVFFILN
jgi:hypothetical protein